MEFYPFREDLTKIINEFYKREKKVKFNPVMVIIFSQVYQFLYYIDGDKRLAKNFFNENKEKFSHIPREIMSFNPSAELQEFLENLPKNSSVKSIFTTDSRVHDLLKALKLKNLDDYLDSTKRLYIEVLNYAYNLDNPIQRKILLSFVSNLDLFMSMSSYIIQNSYSDKVASFANIFPVSTRNSFINYNQYINQFAGIESI